MSEPKRYAFSPEFSTDDCTMQTDDGEWVKWDDYAILKAHIDAKMFVGVPYADYEKLFAENARLKSEVKRLEYTNQTVSVRDYNNVLDKSAIIYEKSTKLLMQATERILKLEAEIERLTKAGNDKMIEVTYIKGIAGIDKNKQSEGMETLKKLTSMNRNDHS